MNVRARAVVLAAWLGASAGCGQQGPLVLPEDARPIERVEPPAAEPDPTDDERTRER
jgi:predicted small lipoprotein YifL